MTWIASGDDRRGPRRRAEGVERASRSSRREPDAYHGYYNVVANPMLWFIQHGLWGRGAAPRPRRRVPRRVARLRDGQPRCSPSESLSSWTTNPMRRFSSRTTTSTSRPGTCARRGPTRSSRTSSTSRGRSTGRCCRSAMRGAVHDGLLANDVVGVPHGAVGAQLRGELCGDRRRLRTRRASRTTRSRSTPPSSTSSRSRPAVLAEERAIAASRPEKLVAARRPHRPVEEHRARLRGVRRPARRASRVARPRADARAARSVAAGDPRVRRVRRGDRARRPRRSTTRHRGWRRSTCGSRTTSRGRSPRTSSSTCCS